MLRSPALALAGLIVLGASSLFADEQKPKAFDKSEVTKGEAKEREKGEKKKGDGDDRDEKPADDLYEAIVIPSHANSFGDLVSPTTYGHWGATGTLLSIDPIQDSLAMILSTQPLDPHGAPFQRVSNAIVAAFQ